MKYNKWVSSDGRSEIEMWATVNYKDIKPNTYKVSTLGEIVKIKSNKVLRGNNPDNEKGYVRVALLTSDNKIKKYPLHRIVMAMFIGANDEFEVNHIDGNKLNNKLSNLEYSTRKENAHHASKNELYQMGDKHYKATVTNDQVHQICRYIVKGYANKEIAKLMDFPWTDKTKYLISSIRTRKSWKSISKFYSWKRGPVYKHYMEEDINSICKMLFIDNMKISNITQKFPQYDQNKLYVAIKQIKRGKLYKSISDKYRQSSTTIEKVITE